MKSKTSQSLTSTNASSSRLSVQDQIVNNELASCLCSFFKESLSSSVTSSLAPACYFQLFRILHDLVNSFPLLIEDKKYVKEVQDITHKLFELCNSIVALSLEQTTWLRKNYQVKLGSISSSSSNQAAYANSVQTGSAQSSLNNSSQAIGANTASTSTVIAGAGPGMGGPILILSDKSNISLSNVSTSTAITTSTNVSNASGFVGANSALSSSASASSSSNNTEKAKQQNAIVNSRTLSDIESGKSKINEPFKML